MRYYTYKKTKKLYGTIVLLATVNVNNEYIGLAQEKFYKVKSNDLIEIYNFIVCIPKGDHYIPIGYSDINEWMQQEKDKNILSSSENEIIKVCKNIKDGFGHLYWKNINTMFDSLKLEDLEDIKDAIVSNFMLYKVVKRCYEQKFPIQEYVISEIPYGDTSCWIMDFVNAKDLNDYYIKKKNIKIREIDFVVEKIGKTIHHKYNHRNLYESNNCRSAIWI